jgi:hypothetical protein
MVCEQKECERVRVRERGIRSRGATNPPSSMLSMPLGPKEGLKLYETISPSSPSSVAAPRIASELKLPKVLLKVAAKGSFELTCELLLVMVLRESTVTTVDCSPWDCENAHVRPPQPCNIRVMGSACSPASARCRRDPCACSFFSLSVPYSCSDPAPTPYNINIIIHSLICWCKEDL